MVGGRKSALTEEKDERNEEKLGLHIETLMQRVMHSGVHVQF